MSRPPRASGAAKTGKNGHRTGVPTTAAKHQEPERVLVVAGDPESCVAVRRALGAGRSLDFAPNAEAATRRLEEEAFDLVVIGPLESGTTDGLKFFRTVKRKWPDQRVIYNSDPTYFGRKAKHDATASPRAADGQRFDAKLLEAAVKIMTEGVPLKHETVRKAAIEQMGKWAVEQAAQQEDWKGMAADATENAREMKQLGDDKLAGLLAEVARLSNEAVRQCGEAVIYAKAAKAAAERIDQAGYMQAHGPAKVHRWNGQALGNKVAELLVSAGQTNSRHTVN